MPPGSMQICLLVQPECLMQIDDNRHTPAEAVMCHEHVAKHTAEAQRDKDA